MAILASLQDNFHNDSFNTGLWTRTNSTQVQEINSQLQFTTIVGGNYVSIDSVTTTFDLTGSYGLVRMLNGGNQSLASLEVYPVILIKDASNLVQWYLNAGTLKCLKKIATTQTQQGSSLTYNATLHKWFRIRESGGTVFWDYSADAVTWTNQTSIAVASLFAVTAMQVEITTGTFSAEASATTTMFDNFNIPGIGKLNNGRLRPRQFGPGLAR